MHQETFKTATRIQSRIKELNDNIRKIGLLHSFGNFTYHLHGTDDQLYIDKEDFYGIRPILIEKWQKEVESLTDEFKSL